MSRIICTTALMLALTGGGFAAEHAPQGGAGAAGAGETTRKAADTICPVTGKPVDAKVPAVSVEVGTGAQRHEVKIGVATKEAAETIRKANPKTQELYAKASTEGKMVEDGKLVDPPKKKK